jgi:putative ATP-dependent DNA ligase
MPFVVSGVSIPCKKRVRSKPSRGIRDMLDEKLIEQALSDGSAVRAEYDGLHYIQFVDDTKKVPRGTVSFDGRVVYGYGKIGRVLSLESGLKAQFSHPFWVEEKIDGFNVRIVKVRDRIIALTRGGYVCAFTTDRIDDLLNTAIFDKHPDLVICGEVAGPENPYMDDGPPFIAEDVRLFVFDMNRWDERKFLSNEEKVHLMEVFQLPTPQRFGRFSVADVEKIKQILLKLNSEWREGVVFKEDSPRNHRAKYTTTNANIIDIKAGAQNLLDLPSEYFTNRILRLVLFLEEQGIERTEELSQRLGDAYINGLFEAIKQVHNQNKVTRTYRCRFRNRDNAFKLIKHLESAAGHVQLEMQDLREEGGFWKLKFERTFAKSSGQLSSLLKGRLMYD